MIRLLWFIQHLIDLYFYVVIAAVVFSWLIAFNVINTYHPFVRSLGQALMAVTEPLLKPIRRIMPDLGAIDISPIVLLLALQLVNAVIIPSIIDMIART